MCRRWTRAVRVWVARRKHGFYPDAASCDTGHWGFDSCGGNGRVVRVPVPGDGQNVGSRARPAAAVECTWDPARPFRGWQARPDGEPAPRARAMFASMQTILPILALAATLAACARDGQPGADSAASPNPADQSTVIPPPSTPGVTASPDGAGPVQVGMTLAAARAALGLGADTTKAPETCRYLDPGHAVHGVLFMVERDTVVRVDVRDSTVATAEGARIGDSESRIRQLYPTAEQQPHKYTGPTGHYLIVKPGADTTRQLIFETDGQRVTTWRAGKVPQVGYVEGCS